MTLPPIETKPGDRVRRVGVRLDLPELSTLLLAWLSAQTGRDPDDVVVLALDRLFAGVYAAMK